MNTNYETASVLNSGMHGLGGLRYADLKDGARLVEALTAKLNGLDANRFTARELERKARNLVDLVRETVAGHYPDLSLRAMVQILVALDHFLEVRDEVPDTWVRGYEDDARHIEKVCHDIRPELEAFALWQSRQPATA